MDLALEGRLLGACAVIAVVLAAVSWFARRISRQGLGSGLRLGLGSGRKPGAGGRILSVLETTFLPNAASVHVVRVAERYYAIGRSGAHIATLCEIPVESLADRKKAPGPHDGTDALPVTGRRPASGRHRPRD